jgi:hypothetical protein
MPSGSAPVSVLKLREGKSGDAVIGPMANRQRRPGVPPFNLPVLHACGPLVGHLSVCLGIASRHA